MTNQEIAKVFEDLANLLDIKGENPFKIRAYKNAARVINSLSQSLEEMVKEGKDLTTLPSIGKEIAKKIEEIVKNGRLQKLEELKKEIPPSLLDFLAIEGLGASRVREIYNKLHITTLEELQKAAKEGKIAALPGFGKKTQEKIAKGITLLKQEGLRFLYAQAEPFANELKEYLKLAPSIINVEIAGSFRRKKESVGDLDIVASAKSGQEVIDYFIKFPKIEHIINAGTTRSSVVLTNSLQVDLRVVEDIHFGSALHYFTGSKAHVIKLRETAQDLGLKINEYGVFDKNGNNLASKSEKEIYNLFGFDYIEPELREDRGEFEAAKNHTLPKLVELSDIKGDLHMHSTFSDGINSIEQMAKEAYNLGYEYIAISDHSNTLPLVKGVDKEKFKHYCQEIKRVESLFDNFKIFTALEVDILEDGSLGADIEILEQLDFVLGAIHTKFKLPKEKQTQRLIKALQNPYLNAIAHPTGRLIGKREAIDINYAQFFKAVKENNKLLEINSQPSRLDLNDILAKEAKEYGIKFLINSDAHSIEQLHYLKYGINQARRAWLEKDDIINTQSLKNFLKYTRIKWKKQFYLHFY